MPQINRSSFAQPNEHKAENFNLTKTFAARREFSIILTILCGCGEYSFRLGLNVCAQVSSAIDVIYHNCSSLHRSFISLIGVSSTRNAFDFLTNERLYYFPFQIIQLDFLFFWELQFFVRSFFILFGIENNFSEFYK